MVPVLGGPSFGGSLLSWGRRLNPVGEIVSPAIWSEMGTWGRFRSARGLVNYTGLIPSLYESGEVSIRGGITHQGSAWLR
jgi:transposase